MLRLISLVIFQLWLCALCSQVMAKTIVVRQDDTGDTTTLAGAIAMAADGDTIDIQQFTTDFDEPGLFNVTGVTFTSTADTKPVVKSSTAAYIFIEATNCSFENIHFVGQSFWQAGIRLMGSFSVSHCDFTGFAGANPFGFVCQSNKPVLQGTFEYCYVTCPINETISFDNWYDDGLGVPAPTTDNLGPILFNHCTIINNNNFQFRFAADFPGDLSNITVRNCIIGAVVSGAVSNAAVYLVNRAADANIVHEYNCYLQQWVLVYGTGGVELGTLGSTEVSGTPIDPFMDITNGDYTLNPTVGAVLGTGSDGLNMGADIDTQRRPIIVRQDGMGDATTIAGALALANSGDTIDIQQFTTDFDETGGFDIDVATGIHFISSTTGTQPVVKSSSNSYIFRGAMNCSFENIHFVGRSSWQVGMRAIGGFSIKNCKFSDFEVGAPLTLIAQSNMPVLQGTIEDTYIMSPVQEMITFEYWYDDGSGVPAPTADDLGPILFDHCTIINNNNFQFSFMEGFPSDLSSITIQNCIVGAINSSGTSIPSAVAQPRRTENCNIVHNNNCYLQLWLLIYGVESAVPNANEIVGENGVGVDPFVDMSAGDYSIGADSVCESAASDGEDIGAYQYIKPNTARPAWAWYR